MPKKYVNGILQDATADDLANLQKYQEQDIEKEKIIEEENKVKDELIASAKKKLQDLGLTVDEIKEAFGI
jgi:hypothetical protein